MHRPLFYYIASVALAFLVSAAQPSPRLVREPGLVRRQSSCPTGTDVCYSKCAPIGSTCCDDRSGTFCDQGFTCGIGSNGQGNCCPEGESCTGPGGTSSYFVPGEVTYSTSFYTYYIPGGGGGTTTYYETMYIPGGDVPGPTRTHHRTKHHTATSSVIPYYPYTPSPISPPLVQTTPATTYSSTPAPMSSAPIYTYTPPLQNGSYTGPQMPMYTGAAVAGRPLMDGVRMVALAVLGGWLL